jgi:hypothetical protein
MFLDEKLLEMCKGADLTTPESIQQLNVDLSDECQNYYKGKIQPGTPKKEAKVILDKTFNLWDSFVRSALKSNNFELITLGKLFQEHSFKKQFMMNEDLKKLYESL